MGRSRRASSALRPCAHTGTGKKSGTTANVKSMTNIQKMAGLEVRRALCASPHTNRKRSSPPPRQFDALAYAAALEVLG